MSKNSDLDNIEFGQSYIEYNIFNLIKIDLVHLIKLKATLAKEFHIQPSEIDKMAMWEFNLFVKYINDAVKEENDQQKQEMSKYNVDEYMKMSNPKNIQKMTHYESPKMPNISIKSPKI